MLLAIFDGPLRGWGFVDFLVLIVIIAACVAIMYVALRQFGIAIPPWVIQIFWIVVVACVAIFAIRFVATL